MLRYLILAVVGVIFYFAFVVTEKFIAKITYDKKRKYAKIAIYAILYFIMACIVVEISDWFKH